MTRGCRAGPKIDFFMDFDLERLDQNKAGDLLVGARERVGAFAGPSVAPVGPIRGSSCGARAGIGPRVGVYA